jgi:hypothetical protein
MSLSDESLSPTVSSSCLSTFAEAKASLDTALAGYQALDPEDDTDKLLQIFFKYLPPDGQLHLAEDVSYCRNDDELRQLADSLDTGLLRSMLSNGGKTSIITPSSRLGLEDSIENIHSLDIESATRNDQDRLRNNCLKRDGHKCVITKCWDRNHHHSPGDLFAPLQAVHIIPFALGSFRNDDERKRVSQVWVNIFRYFPSLRSRLNLSPEDVNREDNIMMMITPLHEEFRHFYFVFEATASPNRYRLKTFPGFASGYAIFLPSDNVVTIQCVAKRLRRRAGSNAAHASILNFCMGEHECDCNHHKHQVSLIFLKSLILPVLYNIVLFGVTKWLLHYRPMPLPGPPRGYQSHLHESAPSLLLLLHRQGNKRSGSVSRNLTCL